MPKKRGESNRERFEAVTEAPQVLRDLLEGMKPSRMRDVAALAIASPQEVVVGQRVSDNVVKLADRSTWTSFSVPDDGIVPGHTIFDTISGVNAKLARARLPYFLWFRFPRSSLEGTCNPPLTIGLVDTRKPLTKK